MSEEFIKGFCLAFGPCKYLAGLGLLIRGGPGGGHT